MAVISSGQITIVDMYDAVTLNAWISATQATSQTYNNTTKVWSPNYVSSAQTLTLNLTRAGSVDSLTGSGLSDIVWTKTVGNTSTVISATTGTEFVSATGLILTTKNNVPVANNAIRYTVEGNWKDPITKFKIPFSADIDIILIQLAKAAIIGNIFAPDGDYFRNNMPASLKIQAELYKDGALSGGSKKFKWFANDNSVQTVQDTDAGSGWRKITATTGTTGAVASSGFDVAINGQGTLTVFPDAVTNGQTFLAIITDNEGGTLGTKVKQYITIRDMDDPTMTIVDSSGGNILKNGTGSTVLNARLYRNGEEIDVSGTEFIYKWYKWQDGERVDNWVGTGVHHKTGKSLSVGNADVQLKTTFKVEVETK